MLITEESFCSQNFKSFLVTLEINLIILLIQRMSKIFFPLNCNCFEPDVSYTFYKELFILASNRQPLISQGSVS